MRIGIAVDGSSPAIAGVELVASLPLSGRDQVTVVSVAELPVMLRALQFTRAPSEADSMDELHEMSSDRAHSVPENAVERLIGLPRPVRVIDWRQSRRRVGPPQPGTPPEEASSSSNESAEFTVGIVR